MSARYLSRSGSLHTLDKKSVIRERKGIFAAILARDHILLTWPECAPDIAELPVGGIKKKEDPEQGLLREIYEETDVAIKSAKPAAQFDTFVHYYADKDEEYWDYTQSYWLLEGKDIDKLWFKGDTEPEDALKASWVPFKKLAAMNLHAAHRLGFEGLGLLKEKRGTGT